MYKRQGLASLGGHTRRNRFASSSRDLSPSRPAEFADFSECFIVGTAAEVMPVGSIGDYKFTVGDITRNLMDDYAALVRPAKAVAAAG